MQQHARSALVNRVPESLWYAFKHFIGRFGRVIPVPHVNYARIRYMSGRSRDDLCCMTLRYCMQPLVFVRNGPNDVVQCAIVSQYEITSVEDYHACKGTIFGEQAPIQRGFGNLHKEFLAGHSHVPSTAFRRVSGGSSNTLEHFSTCHPPPEHAGRFALLLHHTISARPR